MVATAGAQLLPDNAIETLVTELLPLTTILTPNLPEAQLLAKHAGTPFEDIRGIADLQKLAEFISTLGPKYVLLKGGHLPLSKDRIVSSNDADKHVVVDVLYGEQQSWVFESEYIQSKNTHGTGCSLACTLAVVILTKEPELTTRSRHCVQHRFRQRYPTSSKEGNAICGGWHPNKLEPGQRKWTDQSLPLKLYAAVCTVSSTLLSTHPTTH